MVAKKSPELLPAGWTVQFKAQKTGRKVRVYTNLETGKEFFSKDDVFNYIKAGSHHCGKPQSTNRNITTEAEKIPLQPVNDKDDLPEWLPKGWKVVVKTRKSGLLMGKEYKVYINPFNSCKFYSKQEVLRYLKTVGRKTHRTRDVETVKGKSCISNKETDTSMCSADEVAVQKCEVEDLPSGWIKEIRIRKTSDFIRKDPYYTDPVTGYIFRSKKAALHYVETGEISRHVIKPKNSEELVKDDIAPSSAAKRQKLEHPASRRQLFAAGKMGSDMSNLELSKTFGSKIAGAKRVSPEAKVTFSSRDEITQGKQPLDNAIQECGETKEKDVPKRSSLLKAEGSTSGGDKMSLLSDAGVSDKSRGKKNFAEYKPLSTPAPDVLQEKNFLGTAMEKSSVRETRAKSKDKEVRNLPPRSSKRLAGIEPDQLMNLDKGERALKTEIMKSRKSEAIQDAGMTSDGLVHGASAQLETRPETELADHVSTKTNDSLHRDPSNKSLKPFEDQVAPEDLHLNLETEKINDNPEPQFSLLFGSDPCLEFAFKTLLGELPLDDTPLEDPISTEAGGTLQDDLIESKMGKKGTGRGRVSRSKSKNKKTLLGELPLDDTPLVEPILTEAGGTLQQDMLESEIEKSSTGRGRDGRNRSKNNKTVLSEVPLDDSTLVKPIFTEAGSTLQHDLLESEIEKSSTGKGRVTRHKSKSKKEPNLPRRLSKRLAGVEPEVMPSPVASERALPNASRKPNEESITSSTNLLDEANQPLGAGPEIELQTELSNTDASVRAEPLKKMESFEDLAAPHDQQQMHETQKEEVEKAEPNLSFSFVDYWSDPCLDFAFKTLTGIIPIEDSFVQGDFQPQVDISHNHRNGNLALPDFGSPSLFQTDISSQFDAPDKSALGQQSSVTPTFLPAGNVNFPSCSGVRSQRRQ
ncbi:Methyl-CpG DNA binding [Parasponia andersonii]|uniref:Methyl-CpG DNA binding n=1 Tax=Parasponia andersonii TaxID=3476 RepID=A0A2P5CP44_PARAD|nr:Methyl-CpG DNA binding [Parasponia andersonii]